MRPRILIPAILMVMITAVLLITRLAPWKTKDTRGSDPHANSSTEPSGAEGATAEASAPILARIASTLQQRRLGTAVGAANNRMHLYAKLVDQFDQPLPDVHLSLRLKRWVVVPPFSFDSKYDKVQVTSDRQGRVDYDAGPGDCITILEATSPGLELELKLGAAVSFGQAAVTEGTVPTKDKPVTLQLGRSLGKDLVLRRIMELNVTSSIPVYADLVTGMVTRELSSRSDMKLVLKMTEPGFGESRVPGSSDAVALEVQVMTGGLAEAPFYFMYQAPSQGYSNIAVRVLPGRRQSPETGKHRFSFYFRIRDKFFGSAVVETPTSGSDGHSSLRLTSVINPNGGRILQEDPTRVYEADRIDRDELSRRTASR